jgi:arsenite methyltransferase
MAKESSVADAISKQADYGIDAPPVIRNLALIGLASIAAGVVLNRRIAAAQSTLAAILLIWGVVAGVSMLITAGLMVWSSKVGKLRLRERLIDALALRGDEIVLDIGCGRGLLLNAAARRLTTGKAIGIDLWQSQDQSGNYPEVTLANARAEGVANRVDIKTGDMRELPFPDATLDVVIASLAIHNIPDKEGRAQAVREIARVLKPDGQLALLDFQAVDEYRQVLREIGWRRVEVSGPIFQMFPPVRIVNGRKPSTSQSAG